MLRVGVGALVLAGSVSAPQAQPFNPDCQAESLKGVQSQMTVVCGSNAAACSQLRGHADYAQQLMRQGEQHNQQFTQVRQQVAEQKAAALRGDAQHQQELERLERARQMVNNRDPDQVRELQRKLREFDELTGVRQSRMVIADPRVDAQNAKLTNFQIVSDHREGQVLRDRAAIGVPEDKKRELLAPTVAEGARRLNLPASVEELAQKSTAAREALVGYAVAQSLAQTGSIQNEYAVGRAMTPFDQAGNVLIEAKARSLTGGMALDRIDGYWGGTPQSAELRRAMGPESRASISAAAARGLSDEQMSLQISGIVRKKLETHPIENLPPQVKSSPAAAESYLERAGKAIGKAMTEAVQEIQQQVIVQGPPRIVSPGSK